MNNKNEVCNVYWAPYFAKSDVDWTQLYEGEIVSLYDSLIKDISYDEAKHKNMFYCPSFKAVAQNTFILRNTLLSEFEIDTNNQLVRLSKTHVSSKIPRLPSMNNKLHMEYGMSWIFFSEEDVSMTLLPAYFHPPKYYENGNIVPGKIPNISSWFRSINMEFILKDGINNIKIEKNDPLAYVQFDTPTPKKIKLIKFELNDKLRSYATSCSSSTEWEAWIPFYDRFERFKKSKIKNQILKEIKNNLLE